ncbi:hypothetical protein GYMLUDRAFT_243066 [Collybiopsis luxurians FD-317 M1]|uniref:Carboxylic ester hydrolase n=1 Tax=Collybiopsis luxurians FD-317 M1 TaxID=944289 RepID=A0A0D0BDT5_9AGAR|nr:hypothetical protein GYMLUDRAFT_243066 [Collybiopsis luxurians FD-317 M1]
MLSFSPAKIALQFFLGLTQAVLDVPTVILDSAVVTGQSFGNVERFLGMPYAQPPTGSLRFNLPQPISAYDGDFSAQAYGPSCPQQNISALNLPSGLPKEVLDILDTVFTNVSPQDEDCLTVNVIRPANTLPTSSLPVVVWIHGGGFQIGRTQMYDGTPIVERSIQLGEPIIYVSMNYRLSVFGFLASQEVKDAGVGNLGLRDPKIKYLRIEREALRWVQKYIKAFGGDPTKVTIWGESAGSFSVASQMLANGGNPEGLFRAAFMQSGSPVAVEDITNGQQYYDQIVAATGCSGKSDTLRCLRRAPYTQLKAAADATPDFLSYQSLRLAWLPRFDGVFLTDSPQTLVQKGQIAAVPMISGICNDEGSLFALSATNVTSEAALREFIQTIFMPNISDSQLAKLLELYPAQGSPLGNGDKSNATTPEFQRIATLWGDYVLQAPRRFFLSRRVGKQPIWAFIYKRFHSLPILGSFHASDLLDIYGPGDLTDILIRFTATLNPNGYGNVGNRTFESEGIHWPEYSAHNREMLQLNDGVPPLSISQDGYRQTGMEYLTYLSQIYPL